MSDPVQMIKLESTDLLLAITEPDSHEIQRSQEADLQRSEDVDIHGSQEVNLQRSQETEQRIIVPRVTSSGNSERSIFDVAYPTEPASKSRLKKLNDFCFRNLGLCVNHNKIQVRLDEPRGGQGVWPSNLHSMCVKLAVYIGTSEYILAPRLAWHYGGFIFYVAVIFLICVTSLPTNFLESIAGQYAAKSTVVFLPQLGPIFRGLGYAIFIISMLIIAYYASQISWILMYTYHAAQSSMQWNTCSPDYNSKYCFSEELQDQCNQSFNHTVYHDFHCMPAATYCHQNGYGDSNGTHCFHNRKGNHTSRWLIDLEEHVLKSRRSDANEISRVGRRLISQRDFFYHYIRGQHECQTHPVLPACQNHNKALAVAYGVSWVLALLPCFNLWVASTFALVVVVASPLVILLVMTRVLLFPGAWTGVANFFFGRADIRQLLQSSFWVDAIGMTYWSINLGTGMIPTLSSRDRLRHNALRSSVILVSADLAFGLLNSLLLFAVRGHLDHNQGMRSRQLRQLDDDSQALVFVSFTTIVDVMPRPHFWGTIYFGTIAAQTIATVAISIVSAGLSLVDAVPVFRRLPFAVAALVAAMPFLLFGAVLAASTLHGIRFSVYPLLRLQWMASSILFVVVVGFKLSNAAFREQLRLQLGLDVGGAWPCLVVSWLVVCPLFMLFQLMNELWLYVSPPVPAGAVPTAVVAYVAAALPPLVLLGAALYAGSTTPFWALCTTTEQFGAHKKQVRTRRGSQARRVSLRSQSSRAPRHTVSSQRRVAAQEAEDRWALAKRSTQLSVAGASQPRIPGRVGAAFSSAD